MRQSGATFNDHMTYEHYFTWKSLPIGGKKEFKHPTIKDESLLINPILISSNENDIVLDPFMGTCTIGKICKNLNRSFIGYEINEEYFQMAKQRMKII
jgi:site-specific DNA-methyltransferase (adenine-specific)